LNDPKGIVGEAELGSFDQCHRQPASTSSEIKQDVIDVAISRSPFEHWAGQVLIGEGATYRKDLRSRSPMRSRNPRVPPFPAPLFMPGLTRVLSGNVNRFPAPLLGERRGAYECTNAGASSAASSLSRSV